MQKALNAVYVDGELHESKALTANTKEDDHETDWEGSKTIDHEVRQIVFARVVNKLNSATDYKPKQTGHDKGQYQRKY
jgi:hypothetical protein